MHGLAGRLEHWAAQLAALGPQLRGLALDLPGHGGSDPAADEGHRLDALARSIAALADHARLRRFVLVGHSLGAQVALRYAARNPTRVAGLLLADPTGDLTRLAADDREALLSALRRDPEEALSDSFHQLLHGTGEAAAARVLDDLRATDPAVAAAILESAAIESPIADLKGLEVPVWSVVTPFNRQPNALHSLLPAITAIDLPDAGHWLMMDEPDAFNRVLDAFLDRVRDLPWSRARDQPS